jgi:hypothetical protein
LNRLELKIKNTKRIKPLPLLRQGLFFRLFFKKTAKNFKITQNPEIFLFPAGGEWPNTGRGAGGSYDGKSDRRQAGGGTYEFVGGDDPQVCSAQRDTVLQSQEGG